MREFSMNEFMEIHLEIKSETAIFKNFFFLLGKALVSFLSSSPIQSNSLIYLDHNCVLDGTGQ